MFFSLSVSQSEDVHYPAAKKQSPTKQYDHYYEKNCFNEQTVFFWIKNTHASTLKYNFWSFLKFYKEKLRHNHRTDTDTSQATITNAV